MKNKDKIEEFITTALEGGSNYWYWLDHNDIEKAEEWIIKNKTRDRSIHYTFLDAILQNGKLSIRVYDCEEYDENNNDNEVIGHLNLESIRKGIAIAIDDYAEFYAMHFGNDYSGDSVSADALFQLVVLGNVVYG
tara:strand:+ start:2496 stop:2900 length:405 start_codon:yes stop_codon:yes gene_type:complete